MFNTTIHVFLHFSVLSMSFSTFWPSLFPQRPVFLRQCCYLPRWQLQIFLGSTRQKGFEQMLFLFCKVDSGHLLPIISSRRSSNNKRGNSLRKLNFVGLLSKCCNHPCRSPLSDPLSLCPQGSVFLPQCCYLPRGQLQIFLGAGNNSLYNMLI